MNIIIHRRAYGKFVQNINLVRHINRKYFRAIVPKLLPIIKTNTIYIKCVYIYMKKVVSK